MCTPQVSEVLGNTARCVHHRPVKSWVTQLDVYTTDQWSPAWCTGLKCRMEGGRGDWNPSAIFIEISNFFWRERRIQMQHRKLHSNHSSYTWRQQTDVIMLVCVHVFWITHASRRISSNHSGVNTQYLLSILNTQYSVDLWVVQQRPVKHRATESHPPSTSLDENG